MARRYPPRLHFRWRDTWACAAPRIPIGFTEFPDGTTRRLDNKLGKDRLHEWHFLRGGCSMSEYAHPEVLVTTDWVASRLNDPQLRLIEVDVDTSAYDQGHVPGAVGWNWQTQLQDPVR